MNVLIIGGSSQLTYYLVRQLNITTSNIHVWFSSQDSLNKSKQIYSNYGIDQTKIIFHYYSNFYTEFEDFYSKNNIEYCFYFSAINVSETEDKFLSNVEKKYITEVNTSRGIYLIEKCATRTKLIFCLSSRMFGYIDSEDRYINEYSVTNPRDFYGETKAKLWEEIKKNRACGFLVSGFILFPCFSYFYTQSNTKYGARILFREVLRQLDELKKNRIEYLKLNDFGARLNWSFAGDFAKAIRTSMKLSEPQDFVLGSDLTMTLNDLLLSVSRLTKNMKIHSGILKSLHKNLSCKSTLIPDTQKAKKILEFGSSINIENLIIEILGD